MTVQDVITKIEKNIVSHIENLSEADILRPETESLVVDSFKYIRPNLDYDYTKTTIESIVADSTNVPPNTSFTPGREIQIAMTKVLLNDPYNLCRELGSRYIGDRNAYRDGNSLYYRVFSKAGFNNQNDKDNAKEESRNYFESIQDMLDKLSDALDNLDKNGIRKIVAPLIQKRKNDILKRRKDEDDIDPFK